MSQANVELQHLVIDAFNRRDLDAYLALADHDLESTPYEVWIHGGQPYRGHAGVQSWWEETEEGIRKDNPARQVRKAKKRETHVYRMTAEEVVALIDACQTPRESRVIILGVCVGARNQELRGLRGEHFQRDDFVWISPDIAKGQRERWVPVLDEARAAVEDIRDNVASAIT